MPDFLLVPLLVGLPALGAIVVMGLPARIARALSLAIMLAAAIAALQLFFTFDGSGDSARTDVDLPWIAALGINLHLAVDGFNINLLLLSAVLFPVVLGCAWNAPESGKPLYLALLLALEAGLLGTFLAQNMLLFFALWEAVLIPAGLLILVFGGGQRREAAMAFFLYTLAGSVLLLAAVITLAVECLRQTGRWSFEMSVLSHLRLDSGLQMFVFVAIMLACLVKCPIAPFHSWQPLAYREAPASVAALMAGALSKMGAFGILKWAVPLAPEAAAEAAPYVTLLALASILYGALLALRQQECKSLLAHASLSHMGYILLGIFSFQQAAAHGALLQMMSHGFTVAGLFLLVGLAEQRYGTGRGSALATSAPRLAVLFMLFILASIALPLTGGFSAEFLVLFGAFSRGFSAWQAGSGSMLLVIAVLATSGMVLGAAYMLRFARFMLFEKGRVSSSGDINLREMASLVAPLVVIMWIGIAPVTLMGKVRGVATQLAAISTGGARVR